MKRETFLRFSEEQRDNTHLVRCPGSLLRSEPASRMGSVAQCPGTRTTCPAAPQMAEPGGRPWSPRPGECERMSLQPTETEQNGTRKMTAIWIPPFWPLFKRKGNKKRATNWLKTQGLNEVQERPCPAAHGVPCRRSPRHLPVQGTEP